MPHVWLSPLLTCTNSTLPAATRVGVSRCRPTLSPSSPCWLRPQQYATCDALTPHVWSVPALIWSKTTPPATWTGLVASFVVPAGTHRDERVATRDRRGRGTAVERRVAHADTPTVRVPRNGDATTARAPRRH